MKIAHTISKLGELANPFAEVFTEVFTEELLHCRYFMKRPQCPVRGLARD
jgi:hypothetical protein